MTASPPPVNSSDPPQGRKRSPWFYAAIGCGLLFVLTVGGCIAGITIIGNQLYSEVNKPLNADQLLTTLEDIPVYQPSELDVELTKVMRASLTFVPVGKTTVAVFKTTDSTQTVLQWYQQQFSELGYRPAQSVDNPLGDTVDNNIQLQFMKKDQFVMVQPLAAADNESDSAFILLRMNVSDAQVQE